MLITNYFMVWVCAHSRADAHTKHTYIMGKIDTNMCPSSHTDEHLLRMYTHTVYLHTHTQPPHWHINMNNLSTPLILQRSLSLPLSLEIFGWCFPLLLLLFGSCVFQDLSIHHTWNCLSFQKLFPLRPGSRKWGYILLWDKSLILDLWCKQLK